MTTIITAAFDAQKYFELVGPNGLNMMSSDLPSPPSRLFDQYVKARMELAILQDESQYLAYLFIQKNHDDTTREISYGTHPDLRRCGHAAKLVSWAKNQLSPKGSIEALVAKVSKQNLASVALLKSCDFQPMTSPHHQQFSGRINPDHLYYEWRGRD